MNYVFSAPDKLMLGARGTVGNRLFLFQVREGRRLIIAKCEKQQLASLAAWITTVIDTLGRPGHLPDDLELEAEFEPDFTFGEINIGLDAERGVLELVVTSDDEEDTLEVTLTKEWAAALAITITRLVEAGRAPCPLCGLPLDSRGHDCPRTNGNRPPLR